MIDKNIYIDHKIDEIKGLCAIVWCYHWTLQLLLPGWLSGRMNLQIFACTDPRWSETSTPGPGWELTHHIDGNHCTCTEASCRICSQNPGLQWDWCKTQWGRSAARATSVSSELFGSKGRPQPQQLSLTPGCLSSSRGSSMRSMPSSTWPLPLVLVYTQATHSKLMLPWLRCALTESCINPIGAQDSGCRFDKKPQYRYSGCHRYDVSALNLVLGSMFHFSEDRYMRRSGDSFFRRVTQAAAAAASSDNTTQSHTDPWSRQFYGLYIYSCQSWGIIMIYS
jgi:hypothetical protein